jgi:8-oxo-dGTP diphosphatase
VLALRESALHVLLATLAAGPFTGWRALPGGRVQAGETLDDAAARELAAHSGLANLHLEQLYTFGSPERDPRGHVVSLAYLGLTPLRAATDPAPAGKYTALEWHPVAALPRLAYDHGAVVGIAGARLQAKLRYTNLAHALLDDTFTLADLQSVYETVLGRTLDRRNFRKKILALGWLRPLDRKRRGPHRPASLYAFRDRSPREVDVLR